MNFQAVIFDMDGVLVNSLPHWGRRNVQFLADFGLKLEDEIKRYFNGRSDKENMTWLKERYGLKPSVEELVAKRRSTVQDVYKMSEANPGVDNLLAVLKKFGKKQALASGANLYQVEEVLSKHNWKKLFDVIAAADHVNFVCKPNPALFLYAAKLLGIEPQHCVVVEDAQNGVAAAKAAGMYCVGLAAPFSHGIEDLSEADLVTDSLENEDIYKFLGLYA